MDALTFDLYPHIKLLTTYKTDTIHLQSKYHNNPQIQFEPPTENRDKL